MIQFLLILLLALALTSAVAIVVAVFQGKRAKKLAGENKSMHDAFQQVKEKAERLQKVLGETAKVEEAANAEQNELAKTPDSGLADRANRIFR